MATYKAGDVLAGGYRVIDVKRGGMGVVYICHQPPDRYYAVKTVDPATAVTTDPEAIEQFFKYFRDEVDLWIRVSRQARQENIVEALLYNEHEHWLFLEYVDGLSVSEAMRRQPLHMQHVVDWAVGVSRGMEVLHSRFSLIHRDLKPQNVLVTQDGLIPKISDLGIAKVLQDDQGENTIIGTKGYRAPETWAGKTDFVSDIYSFGATVYAMATGAAPKGRDNPFVPSKALAAPSELNPRVPPELDAIILKALEEDPKKRYQSFAEITPLLESLGPFSGDPYDEGFHFCEEHRYHSLIRDGKQLCAFCTQSELHQHNLDRASEIEKTVAAGAPPVGVSDPTMPLPTEVAGGSYTVTAPTGLDATVPGGVPQTMAAPMTPTVSAPAAAESGSGSGGDGDGKSSALPVVFGLLVVLLGGGLFWYFGQERDDHGGGGDPTPVAGDPGKSGDNGGDSERDRPTIEPTKFTTDSTVPCKDPRCGGRTFKQSFSHKVGDTPARAQEFCWSERHVECETCKFRAQSRALFQATQGCVCGSMSSRTLDGKDPESD